MHKLSDISTDTDTAVCSLCGPVGLKWKSKAGEPKASPRCIEAVRANAREYARRKYHLDKEAGKPRVRSASPWRRAVAERLALLVCESCGFKAVDTCQLDSDHITPRYKGGKDTPENLMVICANCHRLKSKLEAADYATNYAAQG